MKNMEVQITNRGFAHFEFDDRYGQKCSLQKSSLATEDAIWLGVDVGIPESLGGKAEKVSARMHLTIEQVENLLPILQKFVLTGEIRGEYKEYKPSDVLTEVSQERQKQDARWGEQNHLPIEWCAILGEEVGEVQKAAVETHFAAWRGEDELVGDYSEYRKELIQVAAVAVAMVECLDRPIK